MTKKPVKKITSLKETSKIEKILIENFVSLQKVMVNLSENFDGLTKQISKLLELFEISAKELAKNDPQAGTQDNKKVIDKIDNLLDQNKIIARGLSLINEKVSQEPSTNQEHSFTPMKTTSQNMENKYQRSISSKEIPPLPSRNRLELKR